ncbi:MAG: hypothetical protein O6940_00240 [Ignavibacteria bacterium]|nr:hypothetical protein [Ignavibacteria bacterium]
MQRKTKAEHGEVPNLVYYWKSFWNEDGNIKEHLKLRRSRLIFVLSVAKSEDSRGEVESKVGHT